MAILIISMAAGDAYATITPAPFISAQLSQ